MPYGMECSIEGEYEFSGIGHILAIKASNNKLDIEVTNGLTNEVWQATFEATFIENMTKKTGNFKQFPVFVNMLRSAVLKTTESVWLDLLSYADLEKLRAKKNGLEGSMNGQGASNNANGQFNKRYLILMYNVEFDRIHFPLPLTPVASAASSDAAHVHAVVVRELQNEIRSLRNQLNSDYRIVGYDELKRNYERVVEEKHALEDGFRQLQEEFQVLGHDGSAKQVRMLKNVIRQLEQDVGEMKAENQRVVARKDKDIKSMGNELEDLRSSERILKARVRSLTQELQTFKRYTGSRQNTSFQSSSDFDNNISNNRSGLIRPSPRQRPNQGSLSARDYNYTGSASRSRPVPVVTRPRSNSRDSVSRGIRHRSLSRSPRSPSASRIPVRDPPTSTVTRRTSKGAERPVLPPIRFASRSPSPGRLGLATAAVRGNSASKNNGLRGRTPSVSSIASNNSDLSIGFGNTSMNTSHNQNKGLYLRRAPVAKAVAAGVRSHVARRDLPMMRQKAATVTTPNQENTENYLDDLVATRPLQKTTTLVDRPLLVDSQIHNRAAEMLEIDARLKRLHNLLKENGDLN